MNDSLRPAAHTLLLLVTLAVFILTTVPFQMEASRQGIAQRWHHAERTPFHNAEGRRMSGSDTLGNLLLFLPVGFCLHGWRMARRKNLAISVIPTVVAAGLFSLGIEFFQLLLSDRFTSINDVMNNTLGALGGAWLARRYYLSGVRAILAYMRSWRRRPGMLVLLGLGVSYLVWAVAPFHFTLRLERLWHNWLHWTHSLRYLPNLLESWLSADRREYWPLEVGENFLFGMIFGGVLLLCRKWYWPAHKLAKDVHILAAFFLLLARNALLLLSQTGRPDILPDLACFLGVLLSGFLFSRAAFAGSDAGTMRLLSFFYVCFFMLVLLRPDFPELALQPQTPTGSGLLAELFASLQPRYLLRPDAQPLRLFAKACLVMIPLAFVFAQQSTRRAQSFAARLGSGILLAGGLGLLLQLVRHYVLHAEASLLTVFALMAGAAMGVWLEKWWQGERRYPV